MDEQGKPEKKREGDDVVGEREEKRRKREDDDVGEREEKEGPSQVLPSLCHSVFCCYDDSDSDEEEEEEDGSDNKLEGPSQVMLPSSGFVSKSVFDDDSDSDSEDYLVDLAPCRSGVDFQRPLDPEVLKKYNQQIRESEGFDIFFFPGLSIWTPIVPLTKIKESSSEYEPAVNHAKLAIDKYNIEHDEAYEFFDLERVNTRVVSGCVFYITFQVKNLKAAAAGNGNGTPLETFQARVWEGIAETEVELCRPKPIKLQN